MARKKFPMLALILLIFAVVWFVSEFYNLNINLPWIPLILIVVALGMIINRYTN